MKLGRQKKIAIAILSTLFLAGCGLKQMAKMAEQQEINVNPSPLELHGDSVKFNVQATLPPNMLKKNKLYTIKTYYKYGQPGQEFETFEFRDVEFPNQKVEQPSKDKQFSFFYEEGMEEGQLYIKGVASNLEKTKYQETPEIEIAQGVITTSRLAANASKSAYAPHGYNNKEELIPVDVVFHFDQGSSVLKKSEVGGEAGKELDAFIAAKFKTKTVTMTGTHSPEGREATNEKLAEDRAKVIKDFYFNKMKQYDYKDLIDSIKFETKSIFQNWDLVKKQLAKYDGISSDEKKQIISIISNKSLSFADAQKEIELLPFYKGLLKNFYPKLRTSTTQILKIKDKKTDAEISLLAKAIVDGKASADTLTYAELMYAGYLTPLLEEKAGIYSAATKDSTTWEAHNNLGAVYLEMASKVNDDAAKVELIEKAKSQLEISTKTAETAENLNNLGVCYLVINEKAKALELYTKAESAKASNQEVYTFIKAGKGAAQIRYADYSTAISNSQAAAAKIPAAQFNVGLAQLLTKDFTNAQQSLEKAIMADGNNAMAYYCLAISHARTNNPVELGSALTKAVELDESLKAKAVSDLEFFNYREDANYTNALK